MNKRFFLLILGCSLLILNSCGYTVRSYSKPDFGTIGVEAFVSTIDFTGEASYSKLRISPLLLADKLTDRLKKQIIEDGIMKLEDSRRSQVVLSGEITDFLQKPLRYTKQDDIEEYRINLFVDIKLQDSETGKLIKKKSISATDSYFIVGPRQETQPTALDRLIRKAARKIVDSIVDAW